MRDRPARRARSTSPKARQAIIEKATAGSVTVTCGCLLLPESILIFPAREALCGKHGWVTVVKTAKVREEYPENPLF
jgi:hypothetical protein